MQIHSVICHCEEQSDTYRHCERSEGIHSAANAEWIASSLAPPAMTVTIFAHPATGCRASHFKQPTVYRHGLAISLRLCSSLRAQAAAPPSTVIPRASGVSSTPRPFGSITDASGILGRPVKPGDDK